MENSGPEELVDVYFGALLPPETGPGLGCPSADPVAFVADGFTRVVVTCLSASPETFPPMFRSVSIPAELPATLIPDFWGFEWTPSLAAGAYTFFLVLTPPDALADGRVDATDLIATAFYTLTLGP